MAAIHELNRKIAEDFLTALVNELDSQDQDFDWHETNVKLELSEPRKDSFCWDTMRGNMAVSVIFDRTNILLLLEVDAVERHEVRDGLAEIRPPFDHFAAKYLAGVIVNAERFLD